MLPPGTTCLALSNACADPRKEVAAFEERIGDATGEPIRLPPGHTRDEPLQQSRGRIVKPRGPGRWRLPLLCALLWRFMSAKSALRVSQDFSTAAMERARSALPAGGVNAAMPRRAASVVLAL